MIGVLARPEQSTWVEEFFELFKTPWEFHREGRAYNVVIATVDDLPDVRAGLLIAYGTRAKNIDPSLGLQGKRCESTSGLTCLGSSLPIYGSLATFDIPAGGSHEILATAAAAACVVRCRGANPPTIRAGYELFDELRLLISSGQPAEHAGVATVDLHIRMLRELILREGLGFVEIPPVPAGYSFAACLTHDIDFVGIRRHGLDHTVWGFLYRSTVGAVRDVARGRVSVARLLRMWRAVASLPLVHLGWVRDFWEPFDWYLEVEKNLPATYFLIPFKRRAGEHVSGPGASRRATAYDVEDLSDWLGRLTAGSREVGVHGIDAWHRLDRACEEKGRVSTAAGTAASGIRMHWLLADARTPAILEQAGFEYDATAGYNDTVGFRHGTGQVFRPLGAHTLLELPLHIQDGALFYPGRLDLSEEQAAVRCARLIDHARASGGVLTVLWHDRSHGPERFWGEFYVDLLRELRSANAWFGSARDVVGWFRKRRQVRFDDVSTGAVAQAVSYTGEGSISPPLVVRWYQARKPAALGDSAPAWVDVPWDGTPGHFTDEGWRLAGNVAGPRADARRLESQSAFQ